MKLAVVGASARTGTHILRHALARDDDVTAVVRHPEKFLAGWAGGLPPGGPPSRCSRRRRTDPGVPGPGRGVVLPRPGREGNVRWRYVMDRDDLGLAIVDALHDDSSIGAYISVAS